MLENSGWHTLRRRCAVVTSCSLLGLLAIAGPREAVAQDSADRWVVDSSLGLAWWQMEPHLAHLWATTCPADPAWQPGEGRSMMGWMAARARRFKRSREGYAAVKSGKIPLHPRRTVEPVCEPGVRGEVQVADTVSLAGVHGTVVVDANSLTTGAVLARCSP